MCRRVAAQCLFFFISSRRRHTRYWHDWSSDVCSSDLTTGTHGGGAARATIARGVPPDPGRRGAAGDGGRAGTAGGRALMVPRRLVLRALLRASGTAAAL